MPVQHFDYLFSSVKSDPGKEMQIGIPADGGPSAQPMELDVEPANTIVRVPFCVDMLLIFASVRGEKVLIYIFYS